MLTIELQALNAIRANLPQIAKELKRIADELTCQTQMAINAKLDGRKENEDAT